MALLLNHDYLKILCLIHHQKSHYHQLPKKATALLAECLGASDAIFYINFLNVSETFYDMENSPNVSKTLPRQKVILQDCT